MSYKRPAVVFNENNPMHMELYDWCMEQSTNFSDFARTVLFLYKQGKTSNSTPFPQGSPNLKSFQTSKEDINAMSDML